MKITLREVKDDNTEYIVQYINSYRKILYPMLGNKSPYDLINFNKVYINDPLASFILAEYENGAIAGTIGFVPYDNRFQQIKNDNVKTVEIVKLYVEPNIRNLGIGKRLVNFAIQKAIDLNYKVIYLHTHPFLKGAVDFWKKNGFTVIDIECNSDMTIIHMQRLI
ncbi:GNAT family N-acetyltransferase [Spirosoma sp. BT702]|uniref:GNAT family N-acetyltransferase n=1 Tax=Spirosoma profusum TaxID=2771354 RepID=A0A926XUL4_9BACT|nr:GNAT family N-acetyltransferase [Spirosoma profusum]MBD2699841.1 GNAT family N-acetyltransferase [Spirosoma profusum]